MKVATTFLLALLLTSGSAASKCAFHEYDFQGYILNELTRAPIAGATALIFLDDYDSTLAGGYSTKYPDSFITSERGQLKATSYFPSYRTNSFFIGDICDLEPERVEIVITAPKFISKRVRLRFADLKRSKRTRWNFSVELPAIVLRPSG